MKSAIQESDIKLRKTREEMSFAIFLVYSRKFRTVSKVV